jgi:hypothetical protein
MIYDAMFIIAFLVMMGIIFAKFYNALSVGSVYDIKIAFMLFSGYIVAWVTSFVVFAANPEIVIYNMLFRLSSWFLVLNVLFLIIEIILFLRDTAQRPIKAFNSKQANKAVRY